MSDSHQVYTIQCADDDRQYIGMTQHPDRRWYQHKTAANSGSKRPLYVAMRKFGLDRFSMKIEASYECRQKAENHERKLIKNAIAQGLNPYNIQVFPVLVQDESEGPQPPKAPKLYVSVTAEQKIEIEEFSRRSGLQVATWIRVTLLAAINKKRKPVEKDITDLIEKLNNATKGDNFLDVQIEVVLFEKDAAYHSVRANNAGTKVIYTDADGDDYTHMARGWSDPIHKNHTLSLLHNLAEARRIKGAA